jgi:hypothetical protein
MRRREPRDFSPTRHCGLIGKGIYASRSRKLVDRSAASHINILPAWHAPIIAVCCARDQVRKVQRGAIREEFEQRISIYVQADRSR